MNAPNSPNSLKHLSVPPHSKESEQGVVGAVLRRGDLLFELNGILQAGDFYHYAHQVIWRSFLDLSQRHEPVSHLSVFEWVRERGSVEDIGGAAYLVDLWEKAAIEPVQYAEMVRSYSMRRQLMHCFSDLLQASSRESNSIDEIFQQAEKGLLEIKQRTGAKDTIIPIATAVRDFLDLMDRRSQLAKGGEIEDIVVSGFSELDNLIGGFQKSELILIAARPSVGKTMVASNIIANAAEQGKTVFFATLEQSAVELVARLVGRRSKVDSKSIRTGDMEHDEREKLSTTAIHLQTLGIWFDQTASQSASQIISNARRLSMKHSLDMVVIDYVGLMAAESQRDNRAQAVGSNAQRMRELAKQLNIPVLLLAQLNRNLEGRNDQTPKLSDLKDSGSLEEHADTVIMLHKEEQPMHLDVHEIEVFVRKNRNGPLGQFKLKHHRRYFCLEDFEADNREVVL